MNNKNALEKAISESTSQKEVLVYLGLNPKGGGNHRALKEAAEKFNLTLPVYVRPGTKVIGARISDENVFCENSSYTNRAGIKKRLYESGVKEECALCGLGSEWNGKPITLQLDHINGVWNDNRKENLQIVCPNCHSQTDTFAGRTKKGIKQKYFCECGNEKVKAAKKCKVCSPRDRYDIEYPPYEELKQMVEAIGYSATGRELGCTDNAVRKHLQRLEQQDEV